MGKVDKEFNRQQFEIIFNFFRWCYLVKCMKETSTAYFLLKASVLSLSLLLLFKVMKFCFGATHVSPTVVHQSSVHKC